MPKKKRKLPKNIVEKPDSEVAEKLFGKRLKRELDGVATASRRSMPTL